MMARRFSAGVALMAATACAQLPTAGQVTLTPPLTTQGASSVSYDPITLPTQPAPAPVAVAAPYQPASVIPYQPAPAIAPAPLPPVVQPSAPSPAFVVSAPAPAVVSAPAADIRALAVEESAAFETATPAPLPQSTGRQFQLIEVAALTSGAGERFESSKPISRPQGAQITTAQPFSIPTGTTGRPYYEGSTPPAIEYHIPHIPQEEPLWCWAAAAQQAIGWVNNGRAPAQCAIVAMAHGLDIEECCADREGICARTGEIPAIEKLVERFGGQGRELATVPRDPETIYEFLKNGETLLIRLRPAPHDEAVGIRHMIVVRGIEWLRLPNNQLQATLIYNDPLGAGERAVNFDEIEGFFEQALVISRT